MRSPVKTALLGDLVVAAFEEAALHSADPRVVTRLATRAVANLLKRAAEGRIRAHVVEGAS